MAQVISDTVTQLDTYMPAASSIKRPGGMKRYCRSSRGMLMPCASRGS